MVTVLLNVIVSPCDTWDCSNNLVLYGKEATITKIAERQDRKNLRP